jgi:RES domain
MLNNSTRKAEYIDVKAVERHFATRAYQPGATFLRVRKLNDILTAPVIADFWEAPDHSTPQGRANQAREPLLYVSGDLQTAQLETHTMEDDIYNFNLYKSTDLINVSEIGFPIEKKTGTKNSTGRIIQEFITALFLKKGKFAYDVSNFLAKRFYSFDDDGLAYPSVANNLKGDNLCLNQQGKSKLELIASFTFRGKNPANPLASYTTNVLGEIITAHGSDAAIFWETISKDPKVFGSVKPIQLKKPIYLEKLIPEL